MASWREETQARVKEKRASASYSMDQGDNTFRVLPNKKDAPYEKLDHRPYVEFRIHRDVGPEKGMWVMCGKNIKGEGKCWLCDKQIPLLEESTDPDKRELARKMRPQEVLLLQVSPVDTNGHFLAPKPWWAPYSGGKSLGVSVLSRISDVRQSAIDHPKKGRNVTVERTGTLLKTHYTGFMLDDNPTEVPAKILAQMKTLEELMPVYDPRRQLAAWKGEKFEKQVGAAAEPEPAEEGNPEDYELDNPMDDPNLGEELQPDAQEPDAEGYAIEGEEELPTEELAEEYDDQTASLDDDDFAPEPEPEPAPPRRAPQPARAAPPAAPARRGPAPGPTPVPRRPGTAPGPAKRPAPPAQAPRRGTPLPRGKR